MTRAVRARPVVFVVATVVMLVLHVVVPPLVLSVVRKPADYFAFNAWLGNVPSFLASGDTTVAAKLDAVRKLALFWVSSSNPYGVEWGFTVDVGDLVRFVFTSVLVGAYFALVAYRRSMPSAFAWRARGGALGGVVSVLGLSTGPCSVMGCGAPVMPVVGLVLAGLSSTTLKLLHNLATASSIVVITALMVSVAYLAYLAGTSASTRTA